MTTRWVTIDAPFFGFPNTGHGGYTGGLLAEHLPGALEVRLLNPPPLEVPLSLEFGDETLTMSDGERPIAQARRVDLDTEIPSPPTLEVAEASMAANLDAASHPSPYCMTCGPERALGDGLRVFVGRVDGRDIVAGVWVPHRSFADADGVVPKRFVWAALDCPTYWAVRSVYGRTGQLTTARLAVDAMRPVLVGEPLVVMGWPIAQRGTRLSIAGAALIAPDGEPRAVAEATWFGDPTT